MEAPGFWDNPDYSNKKMKELKNLKDTVDQINGLETQYEDIETLIEMGNEEEDEGMAEEIRGELDSFAAELETLRISTTPERAARKAATGAACFIACIPDGRKRRAFRWKCWTIWTAMRPASNLSPSR